MDNLGERLHELIREKFQSVPKLAKHLGIPQQTVYSMLRNGIVGSSLHTVLPIAAALEIDPVALMNGRIVPSSDVTKNYFDTPVWDLQELGCAESGDLAFDSNSDTGKEYYPLPAKIKELYPEAYIVRIVDDSLNRILPSGCYALVTPTEVIEHPNKPYVIAMHDSGTIVRRARKLANGVELYPDSTDPTYRTQVIDFNKTDPGSVSVVGEIVWFAVPFDWDFRQ